MVAGGGCEKEGGMETEMAERVGERKKTGWGERLRVRGVGDRGI